MDVDTRHPLIQRLAERQRELNMTDREFAATLNLSSHTTWTRARTGQRKLSTTLLNAALRFDPRLGSLYTMVVNSGTDHVN